ncbi:hypothetical protein ACFV1B_27665 [Streptomyces sp. NPDC059637]|uniref:hypothetical protein n=1 Tax=Streptomyces sp. NPDC059637 TaxID=3347752 RepID=UPI003674F766
MSATQRQQPRPRPATLTAVVLLAAAEGAVLAAWGVWMLVMGLIGHPDRPAQAEAGGLTALALAVLPLLACAGLWKCRRWGRGPALIVQLMALPVAWTLFTAGGAMAPGGIVLGVAAVAGLVLLMHPATTQALDESEAARASAASGNSGASGASGSRGRSGPSGKPGKPGRSGDPRRRDR